MIFILKICFKVFYDDDEDVNRNDENPLLRAATCFIQAETNLEEFVFSIPSSIQALSFIKGTDTGNKTLKISYLEHFDELLVLEIQGSDPITEDSALNDLTFEIDGVVLNLKYLNLDQVRIRNSKLRELRLHEETNEEDIEIKFESVTFIEKKDNSEILPYYKYKEIQKNLESPILIEFSNLILIRMFSCNLQNIHWEMFDGLQNLKYLILEKNNLKFIPNFAFYGTPNLKSLSLARNNLLNIQITDLAGLLEMEYLDLSYNNFSQLSELSFPPFPNLKVADFRDNPITIVFPNTFDIMNTTDCILLGSEEMKLQLLPNSFLGLNQLIKLAIHNVDVALLKQDLLVGMPVLKELILSGNVNKIEFDAFTELPQLEKLILSNCNIYNISMDSFYGLENLQVLDLSKNKLNFLPPNVFDDTIQLKELLLNDNELKELPTDIFKNIPAKLIRLTDNPWHCSCAMGDWDPMVINKIKQKIITSCDSQHDKAINCLFEKKYAYVYENRMAPKCATPKKVKNLSVFQAIRRHLQCKNHKLQLKKPVKVQEKLTKLTPAKPIKNIDVSGKNNHEPNELMMYQKKDLKNIKIQDHNLNDFIQNQNYNLDQLSPFGFQFSEQANKGHEKIKNKIYKKKKIQNLIKLNKMKKDLNYNKEM